jgi:hypothetical protein
VDQGREDICGAAFYIAGHRGNRRSQRRDRSCLPVVEAAGELLRYLGPAFVASVAYIDPGNFATNIQGGSQFGYRLLWVLLWSNAMAILVQYLSAKLGIVTGLTLPQNCRKHFSRRMTILALDRGGDLGDCDRPGGVSGCGDRALSALRNCLLAHGWTRTGTLFVAALVRQWRCLRFWRWISRDIAGWRAGIIGVRRDHRDLLRGRGVPGASGLEAGGLPYAGADARWRSPKAFHDSIYTAVAMLGATVMPHVVYLHSALVQPRLKELVSKETAGWNGTSRWRVSALGISVRADRYLRGDERGVADQLGDDRGGGGGACPMRGSGADDRGRLPDAGAAAGTGGGDHLCGCAAVFGAVVFDGRSAGGTGDYRGVSRHQVPDIFAPADHDHSGAGGDCDWVSIRCGFWCCRRWC